MAISCLLKIDGIEHERIMKKDVFGKGETVIIDRITIPPPKSNDAGKENTENGSIAFTYQDYFYVLRKMFHTFMFDMKEFAIDFYEQSIEKYIDALTWLNYIQSIIYELDLKIEKQSSNSSENFVIDIESARDELVSFLQKHKLSDAQMERCVDRVMNYLQIEKEQKYAKRIMADREIFKILDLKSADLELLRRIITKICMIKMKKEELQIFKLLDKIREIFDDIRDYEEDLKLQNFNTVICLRKRTGNARTATCVLQKYIEKECKRCLRFIEQIKSDKRNKFLEIYQRLDQEKTYYLQLLSRLPVDEA